MRLADIAKQAGVSAVTVSNVINGNYNKVSKETMERIQKIIDENHYQPNATARSLALKESKIIGVVIPNLAKDETFSVSPYNTRMLGFLENYIRREGYYMMFRCVGECKESIPIFTTWNVDGIFFFSAFKNEVEEIQHKLKVPAVYFDTYAEEQKIVNVGIDDYKGGYLAARYLLGKGHRRIAFAGPNVESPGVVQERYRGFCDALNERGVEPIPENCFEAQTLYEQGVEVGKKLAFASQHFTAVVSASDVLALGIMEGLRLGGLNVPEDVSVVGFDNLPECRYSNPQLTTIAQDMEQKANLAGEYLFSMIQKKEKIVVNERMDVEIVERQSVKQLVVP